MREANTRKMQANIQISIALTYDTAGKFLCAWSSLVANVSNDVTPNVILAGASSTGSQKEIQESMTISVVGPNVVVRW